MRASISGGLGRILVLALLFQRADALAAGPAVPPEALHPPELVSAQRMAAIAPHPRLLAGAAQWDALRARIGSDARTGALYAALKQQGEALLAQGPIVYREPVPGENILAQLRQYEQRMLILGMLVRLGGEARYLDAARALVLDLAGREANRAHYLDAATYTLVLALGLDWLYEHWSADERSLLATRIAQQTLVPSVERIEQHGFLWADFNWNQIANNGLVFGALAIAEREPALARHIVNRSLALMPRAAAAYAPDGLYAEGPGYWGYGTLNHVYQIEALRSSLGDSFGLERFPGFLQSAAVLDQLTGPTGQYFNFSDNRAARTASAVVFWFARENASAASEQAEWDRLQAGLASDPALRDLCLALLWRGAPASSAAPLEAAPSAAPLHWQTRGSQPVAVLRARHGDPAASWVAVKGGSANGSHGHMDAGSFVLEAGGVRWAEDPGYEDYLVARRRSGLTHAQLFDYSQDSLRWRHFRLGADGHNVLRFDGADQRIEGHAAMAPIVALGAGAANVQVDLDSTYAGQAAAVTRVVTLQRDGAVRLADRWRAPGKKTANVTWQWLTSARASVQGQTVTLEKDGKRLRLTVRQKDARIEIQEVASVLSARFDAALPGYRRVLVRVRTGAGRQGAVDVLARLLE